MLSWILDAFLNSWRFSGSMELFLTNSMLLLCSYHLISISNFLFKWKKIKILLWSNKWVCESDSLIANIINIAQLPDERVSQHETRPKSSRNLRIDCKSASSKRQTQVQDVLLWLDHVTNSINVEDQRGASAHFGAINCVELMGPIVDGSVCKNYLVDNVVRGSNEGRASGGNGLKIGWILWKTAEEQAKISQRRPK